MSHVLRFLRGAEAARLLASPEAQSQLAEFGQRLQRLRLLWVLDQRVMRLAAAAREEAKR